MNAYRITQVQRHLVVDESLRNALSAYLGLVAIDEDAVSGLLVERLNPDDRVTIVEETREAVTLSVTDVIAGGRRIVEEHRPAAVGGPDVGRPGLAQP